MPRYNVSVREQEGNKESLVSRVLAREVKYWGQKKVANTGCSVL
jgi:hypothetical protein